MSFYKEIIIKAPGLICERIKGLVDEEEAYRSFRRIPPGYKLTVSSSLNH